MVEQLMVLKEKEFNIVKNYTIKIKEQTLFKANGEEGLHLWESSVVLARWCFYNNKIFDNKKIIELGSGCGLLGLSIAKHSNAKEIVLTDHMDIVMHNLNENLVNNSQNHVHYKQEFDYNEFTNNTIEHCPLCYKNRVSLKKLNWIDVDSSNIDEKFNIIIGSELIYKGGPLEHLAKTIKLLLDFNGTAYISMPLKRSMTEVFSNYLKKLDLSIEGVKLDDSKLYIDSTIKNITDYNNKLFEKLSDCNVMLYIIKHK